MPDGEMAKFYVSESKDEAGEYYPWEEKRKKSNSNFEGRIEKDGKRKETFLNEKKKKESCSILKVKKGKRWGEKR